jgi:hapalindole biogenesis HpiC1 cyclase-like protein/PEP-CTERM motif-containing protein
MSVFSHAFRAAAVCGLLMGGGQAFAGVIVVNNASFETLPPGGLNLGCGTGCLYSTSAIPGWTSTGNSGQFQPGTPANFTSLSDGLVSAYSNGGTLEQTVSATVVAGVTYTLSVDLGWRNDAPFAGSADLLIGSNEEFQATGTAVQGDFETFTATYLGTIADAGQTISIELKAGGVEGNFDNVRLSSSAILASVPEPASFGMMALGIAGVASLLLRRKFAK